MGGHSEKVAIFKPGREPSADISPDCTSVFDLQPPERWEVNVCCVNTQSTVLRYCHSGEVLARHP